MDKIMVVDDEKKIVHMISQFMKINNLEVVPAYSGKEAIEKLNSDIKLVILDISMENLDGMETCKIIRKKTNIPIIFLSAKSSQYDKVLGFGIGADDYITKPFDPIELVARVKAHIRRYKEYNNSNPNANKNIIKFDNIEIHINAHKVLKNGKEINLSTTEFNLLLFFINNVHTVLTRKQILNNVWKSELYDENTVNTYVKRLRHKIEDNKSNPKYIKSIRGIGYIFEAKINTNS
ncbi:response regulator transcription factor [Caminicella sporogenes]|uniref:response regulator transcription factor n=1 Tax=Caminicella sporogenes TaxID=166485 RepID=UPI002541B771|nr:response regulator transcription factor [Caminicella sporogenes]WIF95753.1 response regulator transcription factor [Caminicella sporogenes]